MPSPNRTTDDGLNVMFFSIPQSILLQTGSAAVLMALLGGKAATGIMQAIGEASEEMFRGDRLPILKFPVETK